MRSPDRRNINLSTSHVRELSRQRTDFASSPGLDGNWADDRVQLSPLYRTIGRYYPEFDRTYDERNAKHYGRWRLIVGDVVRNPSF